VASASLREFLATNRDRIRDLCVAKVQSRDDARAGPPETNVREQLSTVIDEIVRALESAQGLPVTSPLPGNSPTAARHGRQRQHLGYKIDVLNRDFGAIAEAVGELAGGEGLSFEAREYKIFDLCLDAAAGTAIEQYWNQARAALEHASTERVGFLAHELRNALASARMAFAVLKRGHIGVNSSTGAVLERGLARLDVLIGQALLAVHLEAGLKVDLRRTKVSTLLRQLEESAVPERAVTLVVEVDEALEMDADERLLTSALSNLLQNALKFTRQAGHVVLRGRAEGQDVVLEVEDECGGLPPGEVDEMFSPFVQVGKDRRGLGLGLSVTREAVHVHGASLEVRNLPGRGCVFAVRLRRP
jgi:signal transduction histidine kinase